MQGKADLDLAYFTFPEGFYCGEIGGEVVSYLNATMYGDDEFCIIAFYVVASEHRGRGYGVQTWDHVWNIIPKRCKSISLVSYLKMAHKYELYGFKSSWTEIEWAFKAEKALSLPVPSECSDLVFTSYQEHDFDDLLKYDASVFGYSREPFLKKLRSFPQWEGWVVSTPSGKIVGYCVVKISPSDHIHSLAPWYANDVDIARALLKKAAAFVLNRPRPLDSPPPIINTMFPEVNKEGMKLASILWDTRKEYVRMFARSVPKVVKENSESRVFGVSCPGYG